MKNYRIVILAGLISLMLGCQMTDSPTTIAEKFWEGVVTHNLEQSKQLSTHDSYGLLKKLPNLPEDLVISFGDEVITDNKARVETILSWSTQVDEESTTQSIQLQTNLVNVENVWKVDVDDTMTALLAAPLGQSFVDIKEELGKALMEGSDLFKELIEEGAKELGKTMSDGLKEFNKQMQEMLDELKKEHEQEQRQPKPNTEGELI